VSEGKRCEGNGEILSCYHAPDLVARTYTSQRAASVRTVMTHFKFQGTKCAVKTMHEAEQVWMGAGSEYSESLNTTYMGENLANFSI